eukprot:2154982-Rhodomonas_salina.2
MHADPHDRLRVEHSIERRVQASATAVRLGELRRACEVFSALAVRDVRATLLFQLVHRRPAFALICFSDRQDRLLGGHGSVELAPAVLGAEVAFAQEDDHNRSLADRFLQLPHVLQAVHVQPHLDVWQQQLELANDGVRLILPGAPHVREETVELARVWKLERGFPARRDKPDGRACHSIHGLPKHDEHGPDEHQDGENDDELRGFVGVRQPNKRLA